MKSKIKLSKRLLLEESVQFGQHDPVHVAARSSDLVPNLLNKYSGFACFDENPRT